MRLRFKVRLFILICTVAMAVWIATVDSWQTALWFIGVIGFFYWVISTLVEAMARLFGWLARSKEPTTIAIQLHPPEEVEIVDAEVVEEKDVKWWRV